jgi:hypothetical protein
MCREAETGVTPQLRAYLASISAIEQPHFDRHDA